MISAKNGCHFGCELLSTGRGTLKGVILAYAWWLIYSVSCKSHYVVLRYLAAVDIATRSYFFPVMYVVEICSFNVTCFGIVFFTVCLSCAQIYS